MRVVKGEFKSVMEKLTPDSFLEKMRQLGNLVVEREVVCSFWGRAWSPIRNLKLAA